MASLSSNRPLLLADFKVIRQLDQGAFGQIYLVSRSRELYAMKVICKQDITDLRSHLSVQNEINIMKKLKREACENPFIVRVLGVIQNKVNVFMFMEFHQGGNLAYHIKRKKRLAVDHVRLITAEIVYGLVGLHQKNIIYRDLKPQNIMVGRDGHIRIIDFNLSKEMFSR